MTRIRGPVSYHAFRQQVRQFRRSDVLRATALVGAYIERGEMGLAPPLSHRSHIKAFALAGVARTAITAGNDHRQARDLSADDISKLCWFYVNVDEPRDGTPVGTEHLRQMMARYAYEQFPTQLSAHEDVGRSIVLFGDGDRFDLPSDRMWRDTFGANIVDLVNVGFVGYAAAMEHHGRVPVEHMGDSRFDQAYEALSPTDALSVLDSFYSCPVGVASSWSRERERSGYEKWSPSPLQNSPIVILPDGARVVPWPRLVVNKFSPNGLFYPAVEAFGSSFAAALGHAFEAYVGDQLRLLQRAAITGERVYAESGQERKTCDWIIVTDKCVVLVEVKGTRPTIEVRVGSPEGFDHVARKVGKAAGQLETTANLIRAGHEVLHDVPTDRPMVGLVVTLEPFFLTDSYFYADVLGSRSLPIAVSSSHTLEDVVATLAPRDDLGDRFLRAFESATGMFGEPLAPRLERSVEGLPIATNPILEAAWSRITTSDDEPE